MNKQTLFLLECWLGNSPESYHELDDERFYSFVYSLLEYDNGNYDLDRFVALINKTHPEWSEDYIEDLLDQWCGKIDAIIGFQHYKQAI